LNFGYSRYSGGSFPPMVRNLVIINIAVFLLQQIAGRALTFYFGLIPQAFWHGYLWQVFTYQFLHGNFMHIFFNMFVLWMFGRTLEMMWGPRKFLIYYLICGVGAGLLNAAVMPNSPIPTVGASGAVYGLLLAFGLLFPNQMIFLYFLFPIKARYFVIIIAAIEFFSGLNPNSPVAHFAHLGGMIFGLIYLQWPKWRRKASHLQGERERKQHLKVVYNRRDEIEALQKEVDELLDKINRSGLDSLSSGEKGRLKEASRKLKEWEEQGWPVN